MYMPFVGLDLWIFLLLTAMRRAVVKMIAFDHIVPLSILLALSFLSLLASSSFISSDDCLTALSVNLILPKLLFFIYSWDTDFQLLPDPSIIPAFDSNKPSFEADTFHCFSCAVPQALWTFTACHPSNSLHLIKMTIFRLSALYLLSWSGPLLFFSA